MVPVCQAHHQLAVVLNLSLCHVMQMNRLLPIRAFMQSKRSRCNRGAVSFVLAMAVAGQHDRLPHGSDKLGNVVMYVGLGGWRMALHAWQLVEIYSRNQGKAVAVHCFGHCFQCTGCWPKTVCSCSSVHAAESGCEQQSLNGHISAGNG